jgi:hypothetical protein
VDDDAGIEDEDDDVDEGEDGVDGRRAEGVSAEANRAALSLIRASSRRTPRYIVCIYQLISPHLASPRLASPSPG